MIFIIYDRLKVLSSEVRFLDRLLKGVMSKLYYVMMNDGKKDFVAIRQDSSFKLLRATSKTTGDIFNNIN